MNILAGSFMRRTEYSHNTMCNHEKEYLNTFVQISVTFAFVAMLMRILVGCITCSVADRAVEMPKYFRKKILMHYGSVIFAAQNNCKCYLHCKKVRVIANQG